MASVIIDGKSHEVDPRRNLLEVALALGFDLPYFCWHPALGSVGACRQCAVKQYRNDNDTRGRIVMACMTPAAPGTRIDIDDPETRAFRKSVVEWLMANHPHDCPVCDEGGECHLQDMTHLAGQVHRRFRFKKRTFVNQDLGPLVAHEMNRCIECYRCVRFYRDYAGGRDLDVFAAHDHVYFGRHESGTLESPFAGNLVEVCPTGVFTDRSLSEHFTRAWDLVTAPSVCVHCSLGCNTLPGERYGELRRVRNRYNGAVNGWFLCDRGRFGYDHVNGEDRLRSALAPSGPSTPAEPLTAEEGVARLAELVGDPDRVIGLGSPRASLEGNFALRRLVGPGRFFAGVPAAEARLVQLALRILAGGKAYAASLRDLERADAVFVLGDDPTASAPVASLFLRQAVLQQPRAEAAKLRFPGWQDAAVRDAIAGARGPMYVATTTGSDLDACAREAWVGPPEDVARLGLAVASRLDASAPEVTSLPPELEALAGRIADGLRGSRRPVVVSGTGAQRPEVLEAAANVAWALGEARDSADVGLFLSLPDSNSLGLALLGADPLEDAAAFIARDRADTVVVLENDLETRADPSLVDALLRRARHVIVLDHVATDTAAAAELVLPVATVVEGDGTWVNNEGRAQRALQVFVPKGDVREAWRWLAAGAAAAGRTDLAWRDLDDLLAALAADVPDLAGARDAAPPATYRVGGAKVARATQRQSGRTAVDADRTVHEPRPPDDPDTPLSFTMEGARDAPAPSLLTHIWQPNWNSVQALTRFREEINGPLQAGDPGVRLIEPGGEGPPTYFAEHPAAPPLQAGELELVPLYHVFGSEELSARSRYVAALAPAPYVGLSARDARALGAEDGATVTVELAGAVLRVAARVLPTLGAGVAAIPIGVGPFGRGPLPRVARFTRP